MPSVKQLTKSQSLSKISQDPKNAKVKTDASQPEYSPEYSNRNVSVTTAATIDKPSAFQITVSKKPQNEKFLTKDVKSDQTYLLFYNFNDYGLKGSKAA